MSNARRVADIPELVSSIVIASSLPSRQNLLLVSNQFFRAVAPVIWRSVHRIDSLLRLIPGTTERRNIRQPLIDPDIKLLYVVITLPTVLDLTRFDLYAQWVQRLEVFGKRYKPTLRNANALFQVASTRPILPNLRALTISATIETPTPEYLSFTELFLSPTLVEIRHVLCDEDPPYLEIRSVPGLVQKILGICPGVQILELYPGQEPGSDDPSERNIIFSLPGASLHETLAGFSNLRSFASTLHIFEPATLQVLGSLPLLESLDVLDCSEDQASFKGGLTIPDNWFPALRYLHLCDFDASDVLAVWSQPLVRNLVSATIKCDPGTADVEDMEAGPVWVDALLTKLPRASPHISKLNLDFDFVPSLGGPRMFKVSRAGIDALRQLPLRSIQLHRLWGQYEDLVLAFPNVEDFWSQDGEVDLEQLRLFATHMPRLRDLTISVRWILPPTLERSAGGAAQPVASERRPPVTLRNVFNLVELQIPFDQLREMARFLAGVWPGGFRAEVFPGSRRSRDAANAQQLDQLNEAVSEYLAESEAAAGFASTSGQT